LETSVDDADKLKAAVKTEEVKKKIEELQKDLINVPGAGAEKVKKKIEEVQQNLEKDALETSVDDADKLKAAVRTEEVKKEIEEVQKDLINVPGPVAEKVKKDMEKVQENLPFASGPGPAKVRCTDLPEETMAAKGLSCDGFGWIFKYRCNAPISVNKYRNHWVKKKFCQKSCWLNGNGYDGDDCSGDDDADIAQPSTSVAAQPFELEGDKDAQLAEEESVHLERQEGPIRADYFQDEALAEIQAMPTSPVIKQPKPCNTTRQSKEAEKLEEKIECMYREWTDWSECKPFCSGKRTRVRETNMGKQSDRLCSETSTEETCSNICVDCKFSPWTEWSSCPAAEDGKPQLKNRTREEAKCKQGGGKDCTGPKSETQECGKECVFSDWSEWSFCEPCSMDQQSRTRHQLKESKASCPHSSPLQEKKMCWDKGCANPCKWGDWHDWESCSKTCGEDATRQRGRNHKKNHLPGGIKCTGVDIEIAPCNHIKACPDAVKPCHKKKSLKSSLETAKP